MGIVDKFLHELACLTCITGKHDLHAGECTEHGYVMQAVVRRTQCTVGHTTAHAENLDRLVGVGDVHLHLLQAAGHIETSRTADKHFLATRSQAGSDTHGVLLGYAALHKLFRQLVGKVSQRHRATCISGYGDYILIIFAEFQHCVRETLTAGNTLYFHD